MFFCFLFSDVIIEVFVRKKIDGWFEELNILVFEIEMGKLSRKLKGKAKKRKKENLAKKDQKEGNILKR